MSFISQTSLPQDSSNAIIPNVPCDPSVFVGAVVRMDSFGTAINALADNENNGNAIGVVISKSSSTVCTIRFLGVTDGAIFVGLDVTKEYYLSDITPGQITTVAPTASGSIILRVGQPFSSTRLLVNKGIRIKRA